MSRPAMWRLALALTSSMACSDASLPTPPTPSPTTSPRITVAGMISDSETSAPLTGASVCIGVRGNCAQTGADGSYQFTADPADLRLPPGPNLNVSLCPWATFDGYELRSACVPLINSRVSWSTTLQRMITLDAGRRVRSTIFRGEGNGLVDSGLCESCKSFHVLVPASGTLYLSVVPDAPQSMLRLEVFYEGFENGALQITTQRTVQVVVHAMVVPASFELVTAFTPSG